MWVNLVYSKNNCNIISCYVIIEERQLSNQVSKRLVSLSKRRRTKILRWYYKRRACSINLLINGKESDVCWALFLFLNWN